MIKECVVFDTNSRFCIYRRWADPKGAVAVGAIAENPNRRRPVIQSIQPEQVSVMRVAEQPS